MSLAKLVQISLNRRFHPLTFGRLYGEYKHKQLAGKEGEKVDLSALFEGCSQNPLQLKYIFQVLVTDDVNNNFDDIIDLFTIYLPKINDDDRMALLLYFNQVKSEKSPWSALAGSERFLNAFGTFLDQSPPDNERMALLTTKLIVHILGSGTKVTDSFNQKVAYYQGWLKEKHHVGAYEFLTEFFTQYNMNAVRKDYQTLSQSVNGPQSSADTAKLLKLKKTMWLSQQFTVNFTQITNDKFIRAFKGLLNLSRVATSATNTSIAYELTESLFDCLNLGTSRTRHIWRHAILYKLPIILRRLKINQAKLANTLSNAIEAIGYEQNKELIIELLQVLVTMNLVKANQFKICTVGEITPPVVSMTTEQMTERYNSLFHANNTEFMSMEDSGVADFMNEVDKSLALKEELGKLVSESIVTFIRDGENSLLSRLLLSLTINKDLFDYVLLRESPYRLTKFLIRYMETHVEEKPEGAEVTSDGMNIDGMGLGLGSDDESSNAQGFFTDYGTILVFLQYSVFRYNMNTWKFGKQPLTLQLLSNASVLTVDTYMEQLQDNDSDLNSVINDWIKSLFDNANTEGISDELVQRSSLRDYHFIMPHLVSEAITAQRLSLIDEDSLMGGLEYFYEPFLIHALTAVFRSLVNSGWSEENQSDLVTLVKLFNKLSFTKDTSVEVRLLHSMVMEIINDEAYDCFSNLNSLPQVKEYLSKLNKPDTQSADLKAFVASINEGKPTKFDLVAAYSAADISQAGLDWFYRQLSNLLPPNSSRDFASVLSYELIATLMIYYSSYKTRGSLKPWIADLNNFAEGKPADKTLDRYAAAELEIVDEASEKRQKEQEETKQKEAEDNSMSFFGFIQEPKDEEMDVDGNGNGTGTGTGNRDGDATKESHPPLPKHDVYISNLLTLIKNSDSKTANNLVTRILTNLNCIY